VPVTIKGGPTTPEVKSLPKHKKNPDVGEKMTVYTSLILVEQEDALSFDDQEEASVPPLFDALLNSSVLHRSLSWTGVTL
jgi:glutamyl-tRNA synthetase